VVKAAVSPQARARVRAQSAALRAVSHPGVVALHDADPEGRWMATAFVPGGDVRAWRANRTVVEITAFLQHIGRALAALHASGLVHGDVTPDNVLLDADGAPVLIDPGLFTGGGMQGTLGYAAPELLIGSAPTPAADVYGLGTLATFLLTGCPPWTAPDPAALLWLPRHSLPEPVSSRRWDTPLRLEERLAALLALDPARRPRDITRCLDGCAEGPNATVVLGLSAVRERLRRAIVRARDGASVALALVGPAGSGRTTLAAEVERLARRTAVPLQGSPGAAGLCVRVLERRPDDPRWTVVEIPPMSASEIAELLQRAGRDPAGAAPLRARTQGRPGAVARRILGDSSGACAAARALLARLRDGPQQIDALARSLGLSELALLDLADPLLDRGLLMEVDEGCGLALRPR